MNVDIYEPWCADHYATELCEHGIALNAECPGCVADYIAGRWNGDPREAILISLALPVPMVGPYPDWEWRRGGAP